MADTSAFEGFANSPVNKKGERIDPRDVPRYKDKSEAGKVRDASQTTPSVLAKYSTADKSTDGAPAATVPAPKAADGKEAGDQS